MRVRQTHEGHTEIWLQETPWYETPELVRLVRLGLLAATPRLGARDARHPKGYALGQRMTVVVFNAARNQRLAGRPVTITAILTRPLARLTPADLDGCGPMFRRWQNVGRVLGHFEGRRIEETEDITIIAFAYEPANDTR